MENYYLQIEKYDLCNSRGVKYYDFIATLTPRFPLVWVQFLSGHLTMVLVSMATIIAATKAPHLIPVLVPVSSMVLGYALAYIMLYAHEACHYNLAGDRKLNDILANIFIGTFLGRNIKSYREHHWGHHKYHGQVNDTEHAYFDPLNISFFVELFMGLKPMTALMKYQSRLKSPSTSSGPSTNTLESKIMLGAGLIFNGGIFIWSYAHGHSFFILVWVLTLMVFFPFFTVLRPILEHRDEKASGGVNYFKVPHGIVNRMFGDGPITGTFGGAGFNRHLLHHIEPRVSYTRLKEFEQYLLDTTFKDEIKRHQTTYWETFIKLFEPSW